MNALARRPLGGIDMVQVTSLALSASSHLFAALGDASGRQAELLVLRLPEMQPLHATRFAVPSAVRAILVDAHSDWLYLLCAQPRPRLLRVHREYGLSAVPGTQPDAVNLPWSAALPLLLPFPEQRQLLLLAAPDPAVPQSGLHVCRLWLGESLAKASTPHPPHPPPSRHIRVRLHPTALARRHPSASGVSCPRRVAGVLKHKLHCASR